MDSKAFVFINTMLEEAIEQHKGLHVLDKEAAEMFRHAIKELEKTQVNPPAHPAIPDSMRKKLEYAITTAIEDAQLNCHDYEEQGAIVFDMKAARDWLAKCPAATDKAVCPKCGTSFDPSDGEGMVFESATCPECEHEFDIDVVISVISPPSEPKKGSENV